VAAWSAMLEPHDKPYDKPNKGLAAVVFCAVIGLMIYAGIMF
jgi:hypothetical protein